MEPTVYKGWQWILADVTSIQSNCKEGWGAVVNLTVDKSSVAGYAPDSNDVNAGSWRISISRIRYQATTTEDSNRLRTLMWA
jgi:hypothetical protein